MKWGKIDMMVREPAFSAVVVLSLFILAGCPNPITEDLSKILSDENAPVITLHEPSNLSYYSSVILLRGVIKDDDIGEGMNIGEAGYSFSGTDVSGSITPLDDGSFQVAIPARNTSGIQIIDGPQLISVYAKDKKGNLSTVQVQVLRDPDGFDIADFSAEAGSNQILFSWTDVPGAESYTLFSPELGEASHVQSPYLWTGIENGRYCTFQLKANVSDSIGDDAWSDYKTVIPLGEMTLAPRVYNSGLFSLTLEWKRIDADVTYVIERRTNGSSWNTRTVTAEHLFEDDQCTEDAWYEYRIFPEGFELIKSAAVSAYPFNRSIRAAEHISRYNTTGEAYDTITDGDYTYVADGSGGLKILDISESRNPRLAGSLPLNGYSYKIAKQGNFVFVLPDKKEIQVIDVSTPSNPFQVTTAPLSNSPRNMTHYGDFLYVTTHFGDRLEIIDISNPLLPVHRSTSSDALLARPYGIAADGSHVYISAENGNLEIWDVTNPSVPIRTGSVSIGGKAGGMALSGSYLFAATDNNQGIKIVNVSNPSLPAVAQTYKYGADADEDPADIAISGSRAFALDATRGVIVLDISNPLSPSEIDRVTESGGKQVEYYNKLLYLSAGYTGMEIIALGTLDEVAHVKDIDSTYACRDVLLGESRLFLMDYDGFQVFTIDNPANPLPADRYSSIYGTYGDYDESTIPADTNGSYLFASFDRKNIEIIDVKDPDNISLVSEFLVAITDNIRDIKVVGPYLHIIKQAEGLTILDIQNPENPYVAGLSGVPSDQVGGVTADADYVYATSWTGVQAVNISDVYNATPEWSVFSGPKAMDIVTANGKGYFTYEHARLYIFDTDPSSATWKSILGSISFQDIGYADRLCAVQDLAFVATHEGGLKIVNTSNPAAPVLSSELTARNDTFGVAVAGNYIYIADAHTDPMTQGSSGLQVYRFD